jgi:hypothetical protein
VKLLRTIRLDPSDTFVFPMAAEPGDWAISGAFVFAGDDPAALQGKRRAAFRSGFLGVPSFGWSTLAQVVEVDDAGKESAITATAQCLVERCGAPDLATARAAAMEEIAFAASLCDHPRDTLIAVHRREEDGDIRESFRSLHPREKPDRWRVFRFLEAEDEAPEESVDLTSLSRGAQR